MTLLIQQAALVMTVQDQGRIGSQRFGLPESGPMDWWAQRAANRLVGNLVVAACLEVGFTDAILRVESETLMAVCGAGYRVRVNGRVVPLWMTFKAKAGNVVHFEKLAGGNWGYLAVQGGVDTPLWLGSRSFYSRAGLGMTIQPGDRLPIGSPANGSAPTAGTILAIESRPLYQPDPVLRVIPGPHQARFDSASIAQLWDAAYTLTVQSDRMGYRLSGDWLVHTAGADLISQGMTLGEIQVPGDGQPIVMMPDHPTTGGYTCIGTVIRADLPLLAQAPLGEGLIRFQPVDVASARADYQSAVQSIDNQMTSQEDTWLLL